MGDRVSELDDVRDGSQVSARGDVRVSQTYPAVPESVAVVRAVVGEFATQVGARPETIAGVKLAVSEAATNAIVHAYADAAEPGLIRVEASLAAGELRVSVADAGRGLRKGEGRPGLGLGLAIIGEVADHVELLQGANGGVHVLMRFAVPAGASDA
jgi:anti-sigma regulatory factor (Ser/Thr protein kinase)